MLPNQVNFEDFNPFHNKRFSHTEYERDPDEIS